MESMVHELISSLKQLDASTLRRGAAEIRTHFDELAWLRATIAIDRALRTQRRSVEAAAAARTAADAVVASATANGLRPEDPDVDCVSQRAAEVARALVISGVVLPHLAVLLRGWQDTLPFPVPASSTVPSFPSWWDG